MLARSIISSAVGFTVCNEMGWLVTRPPRTRLSVISATRLGRVLAAAPADLGDLRPPLRAVLGRGDHHRGGEAVPLLGGDDVPAELHVPWREAPVGVRDEDAGDAVFGDPVDVGPHPLLFELVDLRVGGRAPEAEPAAERAAPVRLQDREG